MSWKIWIHKRSRHGSFVNQTYDKRFFCSTLVYVWHNINIKSHGKCCASLYRSKSFDMIFQLTANPFIASIIKAKDEMTSFLSLQSPMPHQKSCLAAYLFLLTLVFCLDVYNMKKERVAKTLCSIHKNGLVNMICQFFLCKAEMFGVNFFPLAPPRIPRPWPDRCFQQNIVTLFAPIAMLFRDEAKSQYLNEFNFSSSLDVLSDETTGEKKLCSIHFCSRKSWECNMYNMSACSWCQ